MSDTLIGQIIGGVVTLVGLYLTYRVTIAKMRVEVKAGKEEVVSHVKALDEKVDVVKTEINGRMTELLESTKREGEAKGKAEEKKAEQKRKGI